MKVLVCGSRSYDNWEYIFARIEDIHKETPITEIIHGAAKGVDSWAGLWARRNSIQENRYPADWEGHGKAAGPIRNRRMLDEGKPDLVMGFLTPESKGTRNMLEQAHKAGVKCIVHHIV